MNRVPILSLLFCGALSAAEIREESDIKFAFYSAAWGGDTNDSIRMLAHNQTAEAIRLESITFLKEGEGADRVSLHLDVDVPAGGYAEEQMAYVDLLQGDECITRTLAENWKLAEISNYTLNPSVRNLIIEDTDSFRIYQCVEPVETTWVNIASGARHRQEEWVLYHFESRNN
ncbi:MAG: hypothetical protein WD396_01695 [Pseudohongiellaceae bacterium]